jgi:hypothetical protein
MGGEGGVGSMDWQGSGEVNCLYSRQVVGMHEMVRRYAWVVCANAARRLVSTWALFGSHK